VWQGSNRSGVSGPQIKSRKVHGDQSVGHLSIGKKNEYPKTVGKTRDTRKRFAPLKRALNGCGKRSHGRGRQLRQNQIAKTGPKRDSSREQLLGRKEIKGSRTKPNARDKKSKKKKAYLTPKCKGGKKAWFVDRGSLLISSRSFGLHNPAHRG